MKEPVYITLANKIAKMIDSGIYKPGDKLPFSLSERSVHIDQLLQKLPLDSTRRSFVSFTNAQA